MASLNTIIYNTLFRRTSTYVLTMVAGAIVVERIFDHGCDWYWEKRNRGKLWNHIKHKYENKEEE